MKKSIIVIIVLAVLVGIIFLWYQSVYNGLVKADEEVKAQWGNVENQYQRRTDLIPNLVATVKGYAQHEQSTLQGVIEARAKATQVTIDPTNLNEQTMAQFQQVQGELSSALSRLLVSVEAYPDLKANQNFLDLQAQLEQTENRISTERTRFNNVAQSYNTLVRKFPNNLIANLSGFTQKPYFKAEAGAEKAPEVQF
ncbi:MAG: LemA family protein [Dysgonamonadaceae bacterium]|jgi:LemA protein|nr:LemA family protein [Dysgonamonadaceae bacterium]